MDKMKIYKCIENTLFKIIVYPLAIWHLKIRPLPLLILLYFSMFRRDLRHKIWRCRDINWIRKMRLRYKKMKWQKRWQKDLKKFNGDEKALEQYYNEKFLNVLEEFIKTSSSN